MYIRTVKIPSSKGTVNEYVRVVEAYREDGKVKQRVIADLGRKDMLTAMLPSFSKSCSARRHLKGKIRMPSKWLMH